MFTFYKKDDYLKENLPVYNISCTNALFFTQIAIVTDEVCYSSSLVDTLTFLHQMMDFWNNLEWTSPEETYTFVVELINVSKEVPTY